MSGLEELQKIDKAANPLDYTASGKHYATVGGISPATVVSLLGKRHWFLGAAFKYVVRIHKKGQFVSDGIKAYHCLCIAIYEGLADYQYSDEDIKTLQKFRGSFKGKTEQAWLINTLITIALKKSAFRSLVKMFRNDLEDLIVKEEKRHG